MKYFIGIDPGKSGAFAIISEDLQTYHAWLFEDINNATDIQFRLKEVIKDGVAFAALEKVNAMPGQGVNSVWTFAENYGYWRGIVESMGVPLTYVSPKKWQAEFLASGSSKLPVIKTDKKVKDMTKEEKKEYERKKRQRKIALKQVAVDYVAGLFPNLNLNRKKDQDKADAICVALWAKKEFG